MPPVSQFLEKAGDLISIVTGNPVPALVGRAIGSLTEGAGLQPVGEIDPATGVFVPGTSVGPTLAGFPSPSTVGRVIGPALTIGEQILTGGAGVPIPPVGQQVICRPASVVQVILMRARAATGRPVSARKIREIAKVCGLQLAAARFGITVLEVCEVVTAKRRRRARGISAADLRRTRSTLRKVGNIQHDLKHLSSHMAVARRRTK